MDSKTTLAIVIPAYKIAYLEDCLISIAQQINQNFTLYIGNDNSPYDIATVVEKYRSRINLVYKEFSQNLGAISLVKHWERCINMTAGEEWIWLFSDDDMMDKYAVARFRCLDVDTKDVYRFNLQIINNTNKVIKEVCYPPFESTSEFLLSRLQYKYDNAISNYIFSRQSYVESKGLVDFPLGWCSDDASILQLASSGNIILIPGSSVSWRNAGSNISSTMTSEILQKKILARINFIKWLSANKNELVQSIPSHKTLFSTWFYHGVEVEAPKSSGLEKLILGSKLFELLGFTILKVFGKKIGREWYYSSRNKLKRILKGVFPNLQ